MSPHPHGLPLSRVAEAIRSALTEGRPLVSAVVVESDAEGPVAPGSRVLVGVEGMEGSLGAPEADAAVREAASDLLAGQAAARTVEVVVGSGRCAVLLEAHGAPDELVIVGAGHIARPLCALGSMLGFRVTVLDDRPEFATRERFQAADTVARIDLEDPFRQAPLGPRSHLVLVTRGHRYDFEILRGLLRDPGPHPAYVGMVGSRRRVRACFEQLRAEGVAVSRLRVIHAPIGLDIGAETPEEIALSIAGELVLVRRKGTGRPIRELARVVERWIETRPEGGAAAPKSYAETEAGKPTNEERTGR